MAPWEGRDFAASYVSRPGKQITELRGRLSRCLTEARPLLHVAVLYPLWGLGQPGNSRVPCVPLAIGKTWPGA